MTRSGAIELGTWLGAVVLNTIASPSAVAPPITGAALVAVGIYGWTQHEHTRWIDAFVVLSGLGSFGVPALMAAQRRAALSNGTV